jgi:tRNA1Val (adenine37-N6)-methyltransferase
MDTTLTPFLRGKIRVHQPAKGYRFNVDSVLLAGFAWARDGETVLDLGTGSGILLLLLAHRHHLSRFLGVELQPELAGLARRNLEENGWSERGAILEGDLRNSALIPPGRFDLVVCNPPYGEPGRGMRSADPQRALARTGEAAPLQEVLAAARRALAPGGRACLVLPLERLAEALAAAEAAGLAPHLLRRVRHREGAEPHLALIQFLRGGSRRLLNLPDLALTASGGAYTAEVLKWMGDAPEDPPRVLCDVMLGKLARYLRLLGVDAAYARKAEDDWLLEEARRSGRILLTRDRPLLAQCPKAGVESFDPGSDAAKEQLARFRRAFSLSLGGRPPRCLRCNASPLPVRREEVRGLVPPYTYLTHTRFRACPCCGKLTWEGSHLERFQGQVGSEE